MNFWIVVLLVVLSMGAAFMLGISGVSFMLKQYGLGIDNDGDLVAYTENEENKSPVSFSYALSNGIVKAFQACDQLLPEWAVNNENIEIVISPKQKINVKSQTGEIVTAQDKDYIVMFHDNTILVISESSFKNLYDNVFMAEDIVEGD